MFKNTKHYYYKHEHINVNNRLNERIIDINTTGLRVMNQCGAALARVCLLAA